MFPDSVDIGMEDALARNYYRRELHMNRIIGKITSKGLSSTDVREALSSLGGFLLEVAKMKNRIVLPANGEEINSLAGQVLKALITHDSIPFFTPFCPDWSRDLQGKYDFKSLGGEVSFIAKKFFNEVPPLLSVFNKYGIPYRGTLIFANWGFETEIDAKDTYGRKLTQEDVQMCFESTLAKTDEMLFELQQLPQGAVFESYAVVPMTKFFKQQVFNPESAYRKVYDFFESDKKGQTVVKELHSASYPLNRIRLKLSEEENRAQTVQNLSEYATLGQAFGENGIIIACESATATRAYNLPRKMKLPVFYLKGEQGINSGVNIL